MRGAVGSVLLGDVIVRSYVFTCVVGYNWLHRIVIRLTVGFVASHYSYESNCVSRSLSAYHVEVMVKSHGCDFPWWSLPVLCAVVGPDSAYCAGKDHEKFEPGTCEAVVYGYWSLAAETEVDVILPRWSACPKCHSDDLKITEDSKDDLKASAAVLSLGYYVISSCDMAWKSSEDYKARTIDRIDVCTALVVVGVPYSDDHADITCCPTVVSGVDDSYATRAR